MVNINLIRIKKHNDLNLLNEFVGIPFYLDIKDDFHDPDFHLLSIDLKGKSIGFISLFYIDNYWYIKFIYLKKNYDKNTFYKSIMINLFWYNLKTKRSGNFAFKFDDNDLFNYFYLPKKNKRKTLCFYEYKFKKDDLNLIKESFPQYDFIIKTIKNKNIIMFTEDDFDDESKYQIEHYDQKIVCNDDTTFYLYCNDYSVIVTKLLSYSYFPSDKLFFYTYGFFDFKFDYKKCLIF